MGSGNFDNRSIRLNDEANLNVLDRDFAAEQLRLFEADKRQSHRMSLDKSGAIVFLSPLQEAAGLASPQL